MRPESEPGGGARAVVVERLRARRGELEAAIFARVREGAFGERGRGDFEYLVGLRSAVGAALDYALLGLEQGSAMEVEVPVDALVQARRAARMGVGLDTVLRRYMAGHALLKDCLLVEVERGGGFSAQGPGSLRGVLARLAWLLDRLLAAVTAEYGEELTRVRRSPERRRLEVVRGLLAGGGEGGEGVEGGVEGDVEGGVENGVVGGVVNGMAKRAGAGLGYALEGWHVGVVAVGEGAARAVRELAVRADLRFLSVAPDERSVWAWLSARERSAFGEVERALAQDERALAQAGGGVGSDLPGESRPPDVTIALGEPAEGVRGWRLTHRQAQAALVVALRRPAPFTRYADVALLATALTDELLAATLIDAYLAPLEDGHGSGRVLARTLRAYLAAERNTSSAAAALNVSRTTVVNRLRTIERRLGCTLRPCPAELEVALELDELAPAPGSA